MTLIKLITMKKVIYSLLFAGSLLAFNSCEFDNYAEPSVGLSGKIIDSTTGENFITASKGLDLKMLETSWSATPSPRTLNVKDDGTYNNDKLFPGTYQIFPTNGAFWPTDTTEVVLSESHTVQDFTVTPYLKLTITDYKVEGTTLKLFGKIDAPIVDGLPDVVDIRPMVAITRFVGDANINEYSDPYKITFNKKITNGIQGTIYPITIPNMKSGRHFYVRLAARVNDSFKRYNYSEIIEVDIP